MPTASGVSLRNSSPTITRVTMFYLMTFSIGMLMAMMSATKICNGFVRNTTEI